MTRKILILILLATVASSAGASDDNADIVVTVLGSGTPIPSPTQASAAILVQAGSENMMFDCGRGCTTRLAELDPKILTKIGSLFITHLHSDHIVGIDDLWLNGWIHGRVNPLKIWGPSGTVEMMANMRKTFAFDIHRRSTDGVPGNTDGIADAFNNLSDEGVVYSKNGVIVTAFLVDHASVKPAWGFRVDYKGRSVMISGDTAPTENLYTYGLNTDVILQEVISPAMTNYLRTNFSPEQVEKVLSYHTEASGAGDIFLKSKPRLAVYYHTDIEERLVIPLLEETRAVYDGPLAVSHDLFQIRIGAEITTHDMSMKYNAIGQRPMRTSSAELSICTTPPTEN